MCCPEFPTGLQAWKTQRNPKKAGHAPPSTFQELRQAWSCGSPTPRRLARVAHVRLLTGYMLYNIRISSTMQWSSCSALVKAWPVRTLALISSVEEPRSSWSASHGQGVPSGLPVTLKEACCACQYLPLSLSNCTVSFLHLTKLHGNPAASAGTLFFSCRSSIQSVGSAGSFQG